MTLESIKESLNPLTLSYELVRGHATKERCQEVNEAIGRLIKVCEAADHFQSMILDSDGCALWTDDWDLRLDDLAQAFKELEKS